jgi:allantoinase
VSQRYDLIVRSRRVVGPHGIVPAAVAIQGGKIAALLPLDAPAEGAAEEDLGELALLPGLVDSHAHVNEPGRTEWEGFETATRAAARGGITTVVDMPLNCIPVTTTPEALQVKLDSTRGRLAVDCAFWGGLVPANAGTIAAIADAGVAGVKAFLVHSGIDDFPMATEADLRRAMPALAARGLPLLVHAELDLHPPGPEANGDPRHYATYLASRPPEWEVDAIALAVRLCKETGCAVHIVHLSAAAALPLIAAARRDGLPVSAETCPHYLVLAAEEIPDGATAFKCAPPIRGRENREKLWGGLRDGTISMVVSDHSPCTPALKLGDAGDFMGAWGGIASLQLGLSLIWTEARRRGFGLGDLAAWMSAAPAKLVGLGQKKGSIAPGRDADLVAFDPDAPLEVRPEMLEHRHKISPYLGRRLTGRVRATWLRGRKIYEEDRPGAAWSGEAILHSRAEAR